MIDVGKIRSFARTALGAPFRIVHHSRHATTHRQNLGLHQPSLRTPSVPGFGSAMDAMRQQQWKLHQFRFEATGDLLLDTSLVH